MAQKVFKERNGLKLVGDERDIEVPAKDRMQVHEWCFDNEIEATLATGHEGAAFAAAVWGVNLWRVKDDEQRMMFALRWS